MKEVKLFFSFNDLNIIFVENGNIYLKGGRYIEDFTFQECIIQLSKKEYTKCFNIFLKEKEGYCKRFGHFCGVHSIWLAGEENGECNIKQEDNTFKSEKIYNCSFEYIDIEHG